MNFRRCFIVWACMVLCLPAVAQDRERELSRAARSGDADAVRSLIEGGLDVNTKFRYEVTALSYACDRGHVEVVTVLLKNGADVNVKDTFYGATPLVWALNPPSNPPDRTRHNQVVALLLAKGAGGEDGPGQALQAGVGRNDTDLVRIALAHGVIPADMLTQLLTVAAEGDKPEIATLLLKAGAVPLAEEIVTLPAKTLQRHAGEYRDERGYIWTVEVKDGRLLARNERSNGPPTELLPLGDGLFRPKGSATARFEFSGDSGETVAFTIMNSRGGKQLVTRVGHEEDE